MTSANNKLKAVWQHFCTNLGCVEKSACFWTGSLWMSNASKAFEVH